MACNVEVGCGPTLMPSLHGLNVKPRSSRRLFNVFVGRLKQAIRRILNSLTATNIALAWQWVQYLALQTHQEYVTKTALLNRKSGKAQFSQHTQ